MKQHPSRSRSRELVFCALSIALMVVCAWVTVPFGPVPFTLSTFALLFVLFTLPPRTAFAAIAGYVLLGALGLPVFSSFKGGLAALLGPTGGFIVGYLVAAAFALMVGALLCRLPYFSREGCSVRTTVFMGYTFSSALLVRRFIEGVLFLVVLYLFGWVWLMISAHIDPLAAFLSAVAPFVVIDVLKMMAALVLAQAVSVAVGLSKSETAP